MTLRARGRFLPQILFEIKNPQPNIADASSIIAVQHPDFPAPSPGHKHDGLFLELSYGIPFTDAIGTNLVRTATSGEILRSFSFQTDIITKLRNNNLLDQSIDIISSGIPFRSASAFS